jgi:alanyl-tRNA synthetase
MMIDSERLKKLYLEFFKQKNHKIIPNASLIPENDPTVLFTTAGMHPLVPFLLGQPHPLGKRLTNVQKCLRTDDIDEVGDDTHLTFFEMLGNWSLGDYWKEDAIKWSFEFLTDKKWLGLDKEKIYVTVFAGDKDAPKDMESSKIWENLGIAKDKIFYLPKKDNWWGPAGTTGPCGSDTEMFYDTGKKKCGKDCKPGCSCGKYFEIWNDVFMQYNKTIGGKYESLKQKNVDTGMGVERTIASLKGCKSVYEIETFKPIVEKIKEISKSKLNDKSVRIITDHIRESTFIL